MTILHETVWIDWQIDVNQRECRKYVIVEIGSFYLIVHQENIPDDLYIMPFWKIISIKKVKNNG